MMPLSSIYYGFWTGLSVMGQAEAEPVMSEMDDWAAAGPWTAHQLLGIPSPPPVTQRLKQTCLLIS